MRHYCLSEQTAQRISSSDNSYVNNTSIVTVIKYSGYVFAVLGDIETVGLQELLKQEPGLGLEILFGVDFLVASHHGHPSGFAAEWFGLSGPTRVFNIVSERRRRPGEAATSTRVDSRYSTAACSAAGNREGRRTVSTKQDGDIEVTIFDNGRWVWTKSR